MGTTSVLNSVLNATTGSSASQIDVNSLVNTILYADRAPERTWQAEQATLASQTSAINQLQVEASSLTDQINALQDPGGTLSSVAATSSDTSVVTASALPGTQTGNHTVLVNQLATTGAWYSDEVTSSTPLSAGSFDLNVGSGAPVQISVTGGETLDQLASSINGQSLGVTASVVNDAHGSRLSLVANTSGTAADFTISNDTTVNFSRSGTAAVDASLSVDGVPITSASNTVTNAITGLTLNLQSAAGGAVNVNLAPNANAVTQVVSNFVSAYNTLIKNVNSQFAYNSATQTAGPLASDSAIQGLQTALLTSTNYSSGSGNYQSLASLGISTNADGTLSLNDSALTNVIQNNFGAVTNFFQGVASNGFGSALGTALNTYTDPAEGAFTVDLNSISSENQDLTNQTASLELYLSTQRTLLTNKYNAVDVALQQLPQQIKQIQALLDPSSSSSGS